MFLSVPYFEYWLAAAACTIIELQGCFDLCLVRVILELFAVWQWDCLHETVSCVAGDGDSG